MADDHEALDPPATPSAQSLCGYRPLRRIHSGERTQVFLASDSAGGKSALRVFVGHDGPRRAQDEIEFAARVPSAHVHPVLDVGATARDEPVLVSPRLGERLSRQLADGGRVAAGSFVTLIAPLATALGDLHENDRAHGSVDVTHIRFNASGAPILVGADGGLRATPATIHDDLVGLAQLIDVVLAHCDERTRSRGMSQISSWLRTQCAEPTRPSASLYTDLECRVFALADPLPFTVGSEPPPQESRGELRRARTVRQRGSGSLVTNLLEGELNFSLPVLRNLCGSIIDSMREHARATRLLVVGTVVFALCLAGALLWLPQEPSAGATHQTVTTPTVRNTPVASPDREPREALRMLLEARRACVNSHTTTRCLSGVYEDGAPPAAADSAALTSAADDAFPVLSLSAERRDVGEGRATGGVVSFVVSDSQKTQQPVSVLLVRTETGWLIRDIFDA